MNIYAVPADFTATVAWGDGSSDTSGDGKVTIIHADGIGSGFIITGTHTYTTATTGTSPDIVKVTINDTGGSSSVLNSVFAQGTASVSYSTLHVTFSTFAPVAGTLYDGVVASFTEDAQYAFCSPCRKRYRSPGSAPRLKRRADLPAVVEGLTDEHQNLVGCSPLALDRRAA